jgi:hypothetical protein
MSRLRLYRRWQRPTQGHLGLSNSRPASYLLPSRSTGGRAVACLARSACEDYKDAEGVTSSLKSEPDVLFIPVRIKKIENGREDPTGIRPVGPGTLVDPVSFGHRSQVRLSLLGAPVCVRNSAEGGRARENDLHGPWQEKFELIRRVASPGY